MRDRGKGSFSESANFPEVPGAWGLGIWPMLMVMIELQELLTYVSYLYTRCSENAQRNLEIAQIPRLRGADTYTDRST